MNKPLRTHFVSSLNKREQSSDTPWSSSFAYLYPACKRKSAVSCKPVHPVADKCSSKVGRVGFASKIIVNSEDLVLVYSLASFLVYCIS